MQTLLTHSILYIITVFEIFYFRINDQYAIYVTSLFAFTFWILNCPLVPTMPAMLGVISKFAFDLWMGDRRGGSSGPAPPQKDLEAALSPAATIQEAARPAEPAPKAPKVHKPLPLRKVLSAVNQTARDEHERTQLRNSIMPPTHYSPPPSNLVAPLPMYDEDIG